MGEWVLPSSGGGTEPRAGNGASRGLPSTLGSLVRRELLLGAESLLMVSGGLLLSTTGYVGLSANSTRIQKINKKSINSIFNFQKIYQTRNSIIRANDRRKPPGAPCGGP